MAAGHIEEDLALAALLRGVDIMVSSCSAIAPACRRITPRSLTERSATTF
jgi:hypothetical protein